MQPPAGPALPHTRSRPVHWVATAAVLAAVTGGAALMRPPEAAAGQPGPVAAGPDPAAAEYPLDCGPHPVLVTDHVFVDFDGDGRAETVAVVRCDAGSGTPPSGMYVLARPADATAPPRVAEVLVDPEEGMTVERLQAREDGVSVRLLGYSSPEVPRCCPDLQRDVSWHWQDGRLSAPRAAAVPAPA
ncbi:hypothetical protein GCM10009716_40790 [Streptomyces sodiiphilus]|uniref:Secreted protein n=1 Tax=Streptomyces sodiiphilus TaxID=226217 RepID=A0ABP5B331_9ACTN